MFFRSPGSCEITFYERYAFFMKGCETIGNRFHTRMCSSFCNFNKKMQRCFIFVMMISHCRSVMPKTS